MAFRVPTLRIHVRTLAALVALCALLVWGAIALLDPTGRLVRQLGRDQPAYLRREAAVALGYNLPPWEIEPAISALIVALKDPSPRVRECAVTGLAAHGQRSLRAVPEMVALLDDDDWSVRYSACAGLGVIAESGGPERAAAVRALESALGDARPDVRGAAALALIRLGEAPKSVDTLSDLLRKQDALARQRLLGELRQVLDKKDRALIPVLQAAARDQDTTVRDQARALLLLFGPPDTTLPVRAEVLPVSAHE